MNAVLVTLFLLFQTTLYAKQEHSSNKQKIKIDKRKSVSVSLCKRNILHLGNTYKQGIIVTTNTKNEKDCNIFGKIKAESLSSLGWICKGENNINLFSCTNSAMISYIFGEKKTYDYLSFTDLDKNETIISYINPNSLSRCLKDKNDIEQAGIKDAKCHESVDLTKSNKK